MTQMQKIKNMQKTLYLHNGGNNAQLDIVCHQVKHAASGMGFMF